MSKLSVFIDTFGLFWGLGVQVNLPLHKLNDTTFLFLDACDPPDTLMLLLSKCCQTFQVIYVTWCFISPLDWVLFIYLCWTFVGCDVAADAWTWFGPGLYLLLVFFSCNFTQILTLLIQYIVNRAKWPCTLWINFEEVVVRWAKYAKWIQVSILCPSGSFCWFAGLIGSPVVPYIRALIGFDCTCAASVSANSPQCNSVVWHKVMKTHKAPITCQWTADPFTYRHML